MQFNMVQWFHIPGNVYAFTLPDIMYTEEAKQFVRDMLKVKRLPNGTTFWL
jgi:hypothetical protein